MKLIGGGDAVWSGGIWTQHLIGGSPPSPGLVAQVFGALTLAGAGAIAAPSGASAISGGSATGYTMSGGQVYMTTDGSGTAGTITFAGSSTFWEITLEDDTYSTLADQAEIETAAADAPLSSTRTVQVRDGEATGAKLDLSGLVFTGRLTVQATAWGAEIPGVDLSGSENITLKDLTVERLPSGDGSEIVIECPNSRGITVDGCIVESGDPRTMDFVSKAGYYTNYNGTTGTLILIGARAGNVSGINTAHNITVQDCILRKCKMPIRSTYTEGVTFVRNRVTDFIANGGELQGDNIIYKDNLVWDAWSHGGGNTGATGPNNPHSGARWRIPVADASSFVVGEVVTGGTSGDSAPIIAIETNTHEGKDWLFIGGAQAWTGPGVEAAYFDASETITGDASGSSTADGEIHAVFPYDYGDPHNSTFGTGSGGDNHQYIGNITGTGSARADYGMADVGLLTQDYPAICSGPKWNDPAGGRYSNIQVLFNLIMVSDNSGIVAGFMDPTSIVGWNTIVYTLESLTGSSPNIYYDSVGDGLTIVGNVATVLTTATSLPINFGESPQLWELSHENLIGRYDGQSATTSSGDANEWSELFDGPTFTGATLDNVRDKFTPKAGGRLLSGPMKIGCFDTYYDHDTGTASIPVWSKPMSTVQTGVSLDRVRFASGASFRLTETSPFLGITETDELTIAFGMKLDAATDGADLALIAEPGLGIYLRRLPNGKLSFSGETSGGGTAFSLQTSQTFTSSDGYVNWIFSVRISEYQHRVLKGTILDPFIQSSIWPGDPLDTSRSYIDVTPGENTDFAFLLIDDTFLDLHDQTTLNRAIALNGQHPSYGSDGSTLMGAQPLVFQTRSAQEGSISASAVVTGTLTNQTATVPSQIGSGDWSVANERSGGTITITLTDPPDDGGSGITDYEYQIDGGSWTSSGYSFTGLSGDIVFNVSGLTDGTEVDVAIRAVNAAGNATASATKAVTPTTVVAPTAFGSGDWSVADATSGGEVTVSITTLPANGGDPLESIEYRIDGGDWTDIGGTATGDYAITGLTNDVEIDLELRQSNSLFASTVSDLKSVTPTLSANTIPDPGFDTAGQWDVGTNWAVSGSKAVATGASGFQTLNMSISHKATVEASTAYNFEIDVDSVSAAGRLRVSLREYSGATQGAFYYIYDTNTDGAITTSGLSKLAAHTTASGVDGVRIGLEAVGSVTATFDNLSFQS